MNRFLARRLVQGILCALTAIVSAGCTDMVEIDDFNLVVALGLDQVNDQMIRVTAQILDPTKYQSAGGQGSPAGQGGNPSTIVREEFGRTAEEAIAKFERDTPRHLVLTHNAVVVFGKKYAENGIDRAIRYLERERDFRRNQLLVVTDGTAKALLQGDTEPDPVNAFGLRTLISQGTEILHSVNSLQLVVVRELLSPSHTSVIARVNLDRNGHPVNSGLGLLRDGKLADVLNVNQTRALLRFLGKEGKTEYLLPCPGEKEADVGTTIRVLSTNTRTEPVVHGNTVVYTVKVRGNGEIARLCPYGRIDSQTIQSLEMKTASIMQASMQATMDHIKQKNVDAVQFGTLLSQQKPREWRRIAGQWNRLFPRVRVVYDIKIQLLGTGMTADDPHIGPERETPSAARRHPSGS
jgi:spore germination protein KC